MDICYGEYKGRTVRGFIKYVIAKINEKRTTESYRAYVTDALYALCNAREVKMVRRWETPDNPSSMYDQPLFDGVSVDGIIDENIARCGLTIVDSEEVEHKYGRV